MKNIRRLRENDNIITINRSLTSYILTDVLNFFFVIVLIITKEIKIDFSLFLLEMIRAKKELN